MQIVFAGNFTFFASNLFLFPAITRVLVRPGRRWSSSTMLALSSLSKSSRYVGILYAALIFFTQAMYGVLDVVTAQHGVCRGSPFRRNLAQVGDVDLPPAAAVRHAAGRSSLLMIVALVVALSALVLERRVRGVEVVA